MQPTIFAEILKKEREKRGLEPEELAATLGLPHHSIRDWEAGLRNPRMKSAAKWAASLGFEVKMVRRPQ